MTAFTNAEQAAIKNSSVVNEDNPDNKTKGGNNTSDKVFLLSIAEVSNTSYGFNKELGEDSETREAKNTVYVKGQGGWTSTFVKYADNGRWWLRSPGVNSRYAADVDYNGCCGLNGYYVNCANNAVRPALHLNLSSKLWSNGGKVTASGGSAPNTVQTPTPTVTTITVPKKNATKTIGTLKYKVTKSATKNGTVTVTGTKSKKTKSVTIPATIKINGYTFKVTGINAKAFMNCKKLTKLTIRSPYLKTVGRNAIEKVNQKLTIKVPKKQLKKYKKLFSKKTGFTKGMRVK